MSTKTDVDAAIDRLDDALRGAGLAGLEPPADRVPLDEVAEAVAPYELPSELRRFWERVDPSNIAVTTFPELLGPSAALESQAIIRDPDLSFPPLVPPPNLFAIGYSSHTHLSIELVSRWGEGGTIFRWAWDEEAFRISYRSLSDLLDVIGELVSERRLERKGGFVFVPSEAEEQKQLTRLIAAGPQPLYGDAREIAKNLETWPAHWLESSGIDLHDRQPLGATHTIAELVEAAERGPVRGRIAAAVVRLVGIGGATLVVVDDGTRPLDIWCPAGTSPWGPAHRHRFEFEVTLEGPIPPPPDLDRGHAELQHHALAARIEDAQAAAETFFGRLERHRAPAVATDIRPLD